MSLSRVYRGNITIAFRMNDACSTAFYKLGRLERALGSAAPYCCVAEGTLLSTITPALGNPCLYRLIALFSLHTFIFTCIPFRPQCAGSIVEGMKQTTAERGCSAVAPGPGGSLKALARPGQCMQRSLRHARDHLPLPWLTRITRLPAVTALLGEISLKSSHHQPHGAQLMYQ